MSSFLEFLVRHGRLLGWVMLGLMALLVLADILIPTGYGRFPWDSIGGFGAVYGLFSSVVIIVVSKLLGHLFLYRPENYYDEPASSDKAATPQAGGDERHD